jgi:ribosomal-protein-alanine N-acetyltransferase
MSDINLEPMRDSHIAEIAEVERALFSAPWSEDMFRQEVSGFPGSRPMVAVHRGRVIGYVIAWFFEEEIHLVNIAVREDYQSRGVGKLLASYVIEEGIKWGKQLITLKVTIRTTVKMRC